jgi:hypothetical protein
MAERGRFGAGGVCTCVLQYRRLVERRGAKGTPVEHLAEHRLDLNAATD